MQFVDVTNDIAFRKIFGSQNSRAVLISFLNAALALPPGEQVMDVEILSNHQLPNLTNGKQTIVDVKARDQRGQHFVVEMQLIDSYFFNKRVLYYTSQHYAAQLEKGDGYEKLQPVFFIGILEFTVSENPNYISYHQVRDVETGQRIIRDVSFTFIELPKFNKREEELTTVLDQWVFFLKNAELLRKMPETVQDEGLKLAYEEAAKHNFSKEMWLEYIGAGIKESSEEYAQRMFRDKALAEVAKKLMAKGMTAEEATEMTGLSADDLDRLIFNPRRI